MLRKFARKIYLVEFRHCQNIFLRFTVSLFHSNLDEKITSNVQKVTGKEQKGTSNEQKVTSNEKKVTSNEQKVTSNEQNLTSNEQRAKSSASLLYNNKKCSLLFIQRPNLKEETYNEYFLKKKKYLIKKFTISLFVNITDPITN